MDLDGDGYITPGTGTNGNPGDQTVIGNSTPRYEYSFRLGADYKGIDFSIFFQGIGKRQIWGSGQLAIPGYNAKEGALPKTFTTDYWTEERTDAFIREHGIWVEAILVSVCRNSHAICWICLT